MECLGKKKVNEFINALQIKRPSPITTRGDKMVHQPSSPEHPNTALSTACSRLFMSSGRQLLRALVSYSLKMSTREAKRHATSPTGPATAKDSDEETKVEKRMLAA